jgi:hypothetical protein
MSGHFSIKNFEQFQHYRDRSPKWIKLYNELLEDYEFATLPDATKGQLMAMWLLASRMDNRLPADADWLAKRINATEPVNLELLFEAGFIEPYEDHSRGKREDGPRRYVSDEVRRKVLERDNGKCRRCGATERLEIDRIVPVSEGGTGAEPNLQVLCASCSRKKRAERLRSKCRTDATQMRSPEREGETEAEAEREIETNEVSGSLCSPESRSRDPAIGFNEFWEAYPHKVGKPGALRAWPAAKERAGGIHAIMAGLARYKSDKPPDRQWLNPVTFLNQDRFNDQPASSVQSISNRPHDAIFRALADIASESAGEHQRTADPHVECDGIERAEALHSGPNLSIESPSLTGAG